MSLRDLLSGLIDSVMGNVGGGAAGDDGVSAVGAAPRALPRGRMRVADGVKGADCDIPHEPGVYRTVDKKTGRVIMVGQSVDVRRRAQEHQRAGRYDADSQQFQYATSPELAKDDLRHIECVHIERYDPPGNKTRGGNGR